MKAVIESFICSMTGRRVNFDPSIGDFYLVSFFADYAVAYFRGLISGKSHLFRFRGVKIRCKRKLFLGRNVILRERTFIDAMSKSGIHIGNNSSIGSNCILKASGSMFDLGLGIKLGSGVGIGDFAHIGGAGGIWIGDDTIAGPYLSIHPESHKFSDRGVSIRHQGVDRKGIKIGPDCWLGAKVTILDGAHIGAGSVVAAGAVVTKGEYPPYAIIAGVPARVSGYRK